MKQGWSWVFGIGLSLIIIVLLVGSRSDRHDYWVARAAVPRAVQVTQTEDITLVRFPCQSRGGSIATAQECGFYVWKR